MLKKLTTITASVAVQNVKICITRCSRLSTKTIHGGRNNGFTEIRHQKDSFSFHVEALRHNAIFHLKVNKIDALAKS